MTNRNDRGVPDRSSECCTHHLSGPDHGLVHHALHETVIADFPQSDRFLNHVFLNGSCSAWTAIRVKIVMLHTDGSSIAQVFKQIQTSDKHGL